MLEEGGVSCTEIDSLMEGIGFKMGPFKLMDLIGVDVNHKNSISVWEQFMLEPRFKPSRIQQQLVDAGFYGRKTGRGFYQYE
jgi:3-hydroxybutyryl-CoA dehydrogenase